MLQKDTAASLLLRDAKVHLEVSDALANTLFHHEVYFQAHYAIEKAVKAVCDICGIATINSGKWNKLIKTHRISKLLKLLKDNPKLTYDMERIIQTAINTIPLNSKQKYPDLQFKTIPRELFTANTANEARQYAHQFVSKVEDWITARS